MALAGLIQVRIDPSIPLINLSLAFDRLGLAPAARLRCAGYRNEETETKMRSPPETEWTLHWAIKSES